MTEFNNAVEAQKLVDALSKRLKELNYNPDLKKMIKNLDHLVTELSKAEVVARTNRAPGIAQKPKEELARAIDYADKMLLLAILCQ
jgi:ethanolamine utilization cobalamin adenosyltransferase